MDVTDASGACSDVLSALSDAIVAEDTFFENVLLGLLSRGHVLIEDVRRGRSRPRWGCRSRGCSSRRTCCHRT